MAGQLSRYNPILLERLTAWIVHGQGCEEKEKESHAVPEWGGVCYLIQLQASPSRTVTLSMTMPGLETEDIEPVKKAIATAYVSCASLTDPLPGWHVTLEVNAKSLARVPASLQEYWLKELAALRVTVEGRALRRHFEQLAKGTATPAPVEVHRIGRQPYFIQPLQGAINIILPVTLSQSLRDVAMGQVLLQEFVEARKTAALAKSPVCSFYQASDPPEALEHVDSVLLDNVNGGYLTMTFLQRHVNGPHMASVIWCVCSFHFMLSRSLTACKASIHAKMQQGMESLTSRLDSVKPPWES